MVVSHYNVPLNAPIFKNHLADLGQILFAHLRHVFDLRTPGLPARQPRGENRMTDVYDIGKTVWVKQIGQTNILVFSSGVQRQQHSESYRVPQLV